MTSTSLFHKIKIPLFLKFFFIHSSLSIFLCAANKYAIKQVKKSEKAVGTFNPNNFCRLGRNVYSNINADKQKYIAHHSN